MNCDTISPSFPACKVICKAVCEAIKNSSPQKIEEEPQYNTKLVAITDGINQFSRKFYKELLNSKKENVICSPLGAGIILSMAAFGSQGSTREQLRSSINMFKDDESNKYGFHSFINIFHRIKRIEFRLAYKVFVKDGFEAEFKFKNILKKNFRSELQAMNFNNPEETSSTINNWCSEKTKNHVKDIVTPDDVNNASIVLINAVHLSGYWQWMFLKHNTYPHPFYINENNTVMVEMMYQYNIFNYGILDDLDARYVELAYEPANFRDFISMFIILPNKPNGLEKVERNLDKINFKTLYENDNDKEVALFLPKFKFESKLDLTPVFQSMGITDMFTDEANFSGIHETVPLKVDKVIQKICVEVDECGLAVPRLLYTRRTHRRKTGHMNNNIFCAEYPFSFAIYHRASNTVLFQGHVTSIPPLDLENMEVLEPPIMRRRNLMMQTYQRILN